MSFKTVEVQLENGHVRPTGSETLPGRAHALLTWLEGEAPVPRLTCGELAERWDSLGRLPLDEARAFADDLEKSFARPRAD
jgi:hypothetical protein